MTYHASLSPNECAPGQLVIHHVHGVCRSDGFKTVVIYDVDINCLRLSIQHKNGIVFVPQNRIDTELRRQGTELDVRASFTILKQPRAVRRQRWNQTLQKLRNQLRGGQLRELAKVARDTFTISEWGQDEQYIYEEALVRLSQEIALITSKSAADTKAALVEILTTKHFKMLREK